MPDNLAYPQISDEQTSEIFNGFAVMMAPASSMHTYISDNILTAFKIHLKGRQCIPFGDNLFVHLTEKDTFVPDVMVVCDRNKIKRNGIYGAPDLVVEVLSPGTARNDRGYKRSVYEKSGVREYWIADPSRKSIEVYILEDGRFVLDNLYTLYSDEELSEMTADERAAISTDAQCHLYKDLVIPLEDIFTDIF